MMRIDRSIVRQFAVDAAAAVAGVAILALPLLLVHSLSL